MRKPKVAFFSTGDELKPLGEPLEAGQIYDSNRYGIKPLIENFGCEAIDLGIIPDCPETLKATLKKHKRSRMWLSPLAASVLAKQTTPRTF